jgi:hypothetical protein
LKNLGGAASKATSSAQKLLAAAGKVRSPKLAAKLKTIANAHLDKANAATQQSKVASARSAM